MNLDRLEVDLGDALYALQRAVIVMERTAEPAHVVGDIRRLQEWLVRIKRGES